MNILTRTLTLVLKLYLQKHDRLMVLLHIQVTTFLNKILTKRG